MVRKPSAHTTSSALTSATMRVLVAEDQPEFRRIIRQRLAVLGLTAPEMVEDGAPAMNLMGEAMGENRPYHLLITDNNMPVVCGEELVSFAADLSPETRIIMQSSGLPASLEWMEKQFPQFRFIFKDQLYDLPVQVRELFPDVSFSRR